MRMGRGSCVMLSNFLRMSAPRKLSRAPQGTPADVRSRPDGQAMGGWGSAGPRGGRPPPWDRGATHPTRGARVTTYPYESQWGDLACNAPLIERGESPAGFVDCRTEGYPSEAEYVFWARHVCGLAGLRSVLKAWIPSAGALPMHELITRAVARGALTRDGDEVGGLYYRPFAEWVGDDFGIEAVVHPRIDVPELLAEVRDGRVVFASVSSEIRYPERAATRRGGHLVLVHAFDGETATFHNPSGIGPTAVDARLGVAEFARFSSERGMTLVRPA